ncbi:hypothetical protein HD597_012492 [Nonomuraea thailandensis]|uniref:Uncharacterized protein n=1 Tax=Nonomuraea thailandensis TaxID=1188745 RepID=A0A9X2GX69_9ACTN|nr:hypothetical protein [Nonomuraea thailandensis]MCP2365472.1 hypothetical protein [Nonomuraea thailandensis]
MSYRIALPGLCALALLVPLLPAVIVPRAANLAAGAAITALLVVPVVVLRRRRWAPWLGAGLLTVLAVAAAAPLITGLGLPSEEEVRNAALIQHAVGGPDAALTLISGGALRFLPWDGNDLLLITLACLAAAALLTALGNVPEILTVAAVLSLLPQPLVVARGLRAVGAAGAHRPPAGGPVRGLADGGAPGGQ